MLNENVITAEQVYRATIELMPPPPYSYNVMDVVWWMTGLSPTKYRAEYLANADMFRIVKSDG